MANSKIASLALITLFLLTLAGPLATLPEANAADPAGWYTTVEGVLDTDTYSLYPFDKTPLTIGISKFGELIDGVTKIGLDFGGVVDPFAADPYVPEFEWNQGWVIKITYSYAGEWREVWAFALYADSYRDPDSIGGDWKRAEAPESTTVLGGRKYGGSTYSGVPIGYASTAPLEVLYNGPRKYVAVATTIVGEDANQPLVKVQLTFIFDKVKKYVLVYKDIKLMDTRKFTGTLQIEFSNRGEWDLGKTVAPPSYAHFYNNISTCYHDGWHPFYNTAAGHPANYDLAQVISENGAFVGFAAFWPKLTSKYVEATPYVTRKTMLNTLETYTAKFTQTSQGNQKFVCDSPLHPTPIDYARGQGVWSDEPMVFLNGQLQAKGLALNQYQWDNTTHVVFFNTAPAVGDKIWCVYKQFIEKDDMNEEPLTPYIIGEWDFDLSWANEEKSTHQFRAVTVYGVTYRHDAQDTDHGDGNVIDREVQYLLDEVFSPWDLYSAVEKKTERWVEWTYGSSSYTLKKTPALYVPTSEWDQYGVFSERVELPNGQVLNRWYGDYGVTYDAATGKMTITGLKTNIEYKILYSTKQEWFGMTKPSWTWTVTNKSLGTTPIDLRSLIDLSEVQPVDPLGAQWGFYVYGFRVTLTNNTAESGGFGFSYVLHNNYDDFKVFKGTETILRPIALNYPDVAQGTAYTVTMSLSRQEIHVAAPEHADIHVVWAHPEIVVSVNGVSNGTHVNATVTLSIGGGSGYPYSDNWVDDELYHEVNKGRYEWVVVGRDFKSPVDSAGAALVSAAFKNKQVEIQLAGADMYTTVVANQMPWVMRKFGLMNEWSDYYYTDGTYRTALKDDWCKLGTVSGDEVPITTSNMIGVGGPLANVLAYYANDFTDAFYGVTDFSGPAFSDKIVALPCWSKNTYASSNTVGYAVISTYLDINGTELFMIWGHWGRDTFYASKWFHEDGIYEFQTFPAHATSVVLKISYESTAEGYKPKSYSVIEILGTISERSWENGLKGGLHPDP